MYIKKCIEIHSSPDEYPTGHVRNC